MWSWRTHWQLDMPKQSLSAPARGLLFLILFCMSSLTEAWSVDGCLFMPSLVIPSECPEGTLLVKHRCLPSIADKLSRPPLYTDLQLRHSLLLATSLSPLREASWDPKASCPAEIGLFQHWIHARSQCWIAANRLCSQDIQCWIPVSRILASVRWTLNHFVSPWMSLGQGFPKLWSWCFLLTLAHSITLLDLSIPWVKKKEQHLLWIWLAPIHSITTAFSFIFLASVIISAVGWCLFCSGHAISCLSLRGLTKVYWKCLKP